MSIRLRTKKLIWAGLAGAGIMLIISAISGYLFYSSTQKKETNLRKEYQAKVEELQQVAEQSQEGYALTMDVEQGDLITSDMLTPVSIPPSGAAEDLINPRDLNANQYYARADLKANTILVSAMLYEEAPVTKDLREVEYSFIELPSKLTPNTFIDIRIQYPNGDDYIVLSKKKVKDVDGLTLWMNIEEGEILSMSSAIVDAYIEDAKIYALSYVDGYFQSESIITYPVKPNVLELIKNSPNIVNIAKFNLEEQHRQRLESGLELMAEEERQKLRMGETAVKDEVEQQREEDRINALNQWSQQESLIGTGGEETE